MTRLITDADDYRAALHDGFASLACELDPSGRIRAIGYRRDEDGFDEVYGSTHSLDAVEGFADALKKMVAHARGNC